MTHEEFLKGVQKQRSLIRKLLAGEKRRSEVLTDLALQRYGWMIGKFFETREEWRGLNKEMIFCIKDFKANAKNVYNDEVVIRMICTTVSATGEVNKKTVNRMVCYDDTVCFNPEDDIEKDLAPLWVGWEVVDDRMQGWYEKMRHRYGLANSRLTLAFDQIESLKAALVAKEEVHRIEMKKVVRWTDEAENNLRNKLREEYKEASKMINLALQADPTVDKGDIINVNKSAEDIIIFIKKELKIAK